MIEKEKIKEIFSKIIDTPTESINNDSHFQNDLGGDSLDVVVMIMELESRYSIDIDDYEETEKFMTINKIIVYLDKM